MTSIPATKTPKLNVLFLTLLLTMTVVTTSQAHAQRSEQRNQFQGVRRNVATVIFAGLGGAVLGLSTLSFYGEPQDHTGNIYAGLAAGVVAGTVYVLMTSPEMVAESIPNQPPQLKLANFRSPINEKTGIQRQIPVASYSWSF